MSSFKDLRIVDNFYQTSSYFPMPTVMISTLAEDGSTSVGSYSLCFPYYIAGKNYYAMVLEARNSSNTAQHLLAGRKQLAVNFKCVCVRLSIYHRLTFLLTGLSTMIDRQFLVVTPDRLQSGIQSRLAFLLFVRIRGIRSIRIVQNVWIFRLVSRYLQGRIVVHLSIDTFHQLSNGQLCQLRLQKLLLRDTLRQFLLLCQFLFLSLLLCHFQAAKLRIIFYVYSFILNFIYNKPSIAPHTKPIYGYPYCHIAPIFADKAAAVDE